MRHRKCSHHRALRGPRERPAMVVDSAIAYLISANDTKWLYRVALRHSSHLAGIAPLARNEPLFTAIASGAFINGVSRRGGRWPWLETMHIEGAIARRTFVCGSHLLFVRLILQNPSAVTQSYFIPVRLITAFSLSPKSPWLVRSCVPESDCAAT